MFEYLQYRAEGSCFTRINEDVLALEICPWGPIRRPEAIYEQLSTPITDGGYVYSLIGNSLPRGYYLILNKKRFTIHDSRFTNH